MATNTKFQNTKPSN